MWGNRLWYQKTESAIAPLRTQRRLPDNFTHPLNFSPSISARKGCFKRLHAWECLDARFIYSIRLMQSVPPKAVLQRCPSQAAGFEQLARRSAGSRLWWIHLPLGPFLSTHRQEHKAVHPSGWLHSPGGATARGTRCSSATHTRRLMHFLMIHKPRSNSRIKAFVHDFGMKHQLTFFTDDCQGKILDCRVLLIWNDFQLRPSRQSHVY